MPEHDEKGTGKHPHKSTSEPYPHTKESGKEESGKQTSGGRTHTPGQGGSHSGTSGSESSDLKSREYRDKEGNIHHHTHTAGKKADEK